MIDPIFTAEDDHEHRLPAAYSQGFAYVRVASVIDPDDPGPLGTSLRTGFPLSAEGRPRMPLEELLRTD